MAIITISRGSFSGGKEIAERLASRLGYDCLSREILLEAAERYGVSAERLASAIERPPGLLDRVGRARDHYLAFCRATLCEHALAGKLVYHGHAGHFLLSGVGHVIRVRIVAPLEYRIETAMKRLSARRPEAIAHIERVDRERERWTRFLYNVAWQDPANYDVVLNLERTSIETGCDIVADMTHKQEFRPTPESEKAMHNLALSSRAAAALAADARTADVDVDLLADEGVITVRGWVRQQDAADAIAEVLGAVKGVTEVKSELGVRTGILI